MESDSSRLPPAGPGASASQVNASLAEVFDLAPSFLAVLRGPDHVFERVNEAYLDLVGSRDLIGLAVQDALPEVVDQGLVTILDRIYRSGEPFTASERAVQLDRDRSGEMEERFVTFVYQPLRGDGDEVSGVVAHGVDVTEHVRDREALEARESYFRSLIEYSEDKISVLSEDGTILYQSPAGHRLLGWEQEEVIGRSLFEFIHPDDRDVAQRQLGAALNDPEQPWRLEHRMLHKDGSWRFFETVGHTRRSERGMEVITNARDVTDRREQEAELQTLVELMPQLVWTTTPEGYHDFFNQRWYDYTGMERSGDQGWNWKDYLHPDDYERSLEVWNHSLATGEPYEVEYRFRRASDGAYRWFIGRAHPLRGPDGEIVRWFGTCTDVHDERLALEAAEQSQQRFRAVTSATKDVVWDWDLETDKVWWNENVEKVFGLDPEQLADEEEDWSDHIHPEDRQRVLDGLAEALQDQRDVWTDEYRLVRGDGSTAYVVDRGRTIRGKGGELIRMIGSVTDLTERTRLEEELRQAQKMEAIGKLAGGIAHDFNNLLTVITNFSDMLLEDVEDDDAMWDDLDEIRKAANRATTLTRQLLAFGRKQMLQPLALDLNEVVENIQTMLRRVIGEDIALVFEEGDALPTIHADPGQIEQVILNLALNARDAMPDGGTLTVSTASNRAHAPEASELGAAAGDYVRLTVRDTGIGMDAATRSQAFDPFFTTKPTGHGTGLGLATVHGIVTQSGGFIQLESEPGSGTVVRIYLPVEAREDEPSQPGRGGSTEHRGSGTILLVEDEAAVRAVAKRALTRRGYSVVEASNGEEALELLQTRSEKVDLIITDLVMPVMGGVELAGRVGNMENAPPVVFISGYAEGEMLPQRSLHGEATFIEKPFTVEELLSAVATAL